MLEVWYEVCCRRQGVDYPNASLAKQGPAEPAQHCIAAKLSADPGDTPWKGYRGYELYSVETA